MKRKAVIYRDGIRYHMTKRRLPDGRTQFVFWSSHDWPFYHASYLTEDKREAFRQFIDWVSVTANC